MDGKVLARAEATEQEVGIRAGERRAERAVADDHEAEAAAARLLHGAICRGGELDVLLGREPSDVEDDQIAVRSAPRRAQRGRAPSRIEAATVDAPAEHTQALESGRRELVTQPRRRHERAGGRVVKVTKVGSDRTSEPAGAVVLHVTVEVRVEAAVHGDTKRSARARRRPSERSFGRDVDRVRAAPAPYGAERGAGRKADPEPLVAGKSHPAHA